MVDAIVLAGGKSKRFGSDKALYRLEGKTLLEKVVETALTAADNVTVVTKGDRINEYSSLLEKYDVKCIPDAVENLTSPFYGIISGLTHATSNDCLVMTVDTPLIKTEVLEIL